MLTNGELILEDIDFPVENLFAGDELNALFFLNCCMVDGKRLMYE